MVSVLDTRVGGGGRVDPPPPRWPEPRPGDRVVPCGDPSTSAVVEALSPTTPPWSRCSGAGPARDHARLAPSPEHLRRVEPGDLGGHDPCEPGRVGRAMGRPRGPSRRRRVSPSCWSDDGDPPVRAAPSRGSPRTDHGPAGTPGSGILDALLDAQRRHLEEVLETTLPRWPRPRSASPPSPSRARVRPRQRHRGDRRRAASFGWDLTRPRAVLLASIDPPTEPGVLPVPGHHRSVGARHASGPARSCGAAARDHRALVAPAGTTPPSAGGSRKAAHRLDHRLRTVTVSIGVAAGSPSPRR